MYYVVGIYEANSQMVDADRPVVYTYDNLDDAIIGLKDIVNQTVKKYEENVLPDVVERIGADDNYDEMAVIRLDNDDRILFYVAEDPF